MTEVKPCWRKLEWGPESPFQHKNIILSSLIVLKRVYISPPGWHKLDKGAPPPYNPLGGPSAHNQNPMASRSPTWSTYLVVSSLKRLVNHMVVFLMANMPYLPSFRSLAILHGLKEAPVVLWIGPEHLGKGCPPQIWLPHGHIALSIQFQIFRAAP